MFISTKKRAQIWYTDFIIGTIVFVLALSIYYTNIPNIEKEDARKLQEVSREGELITNYLLSEGYPKDWNTSTVRIIGILNENRTIDKSKLEQFRNITTDNYLSGKSKFKLTSDYSIIFRDFDGNAIPVYDINYIGYYRYNLTGNKINFSGENKHLIKYSRVVLYDNKPINLEVYTWQN